MIRRFLSFAVLLVAMIPLGIGQEPKTFTVPVPIKLVPVNPQPIAETKEPPLTKINNPIVCRDVPIAQPMPVGPATVPVVTVAEKLTGKPNKLILIPVSTNGKYINVDSPNLDLIAQYSPGALLPAGYFTVADAGVYRIIFWTSLNDVPSKPAILTLTIGTPGPPNPPGPPDPGPGPTPPTPDPSFQTVLQAAYTAEASKTKAVEIIELAALYSAAGDSTNPKSAINDPVLKTTSDFLLRVQAARKIILDDSALTKVRSVIADELDKTLQKPANLDDAMRKTVGAKFVSIASSLQQLR